MNKQETYTIKICFEQYIKDFPCRSHLQELNGCPDGNQGICHVWFKGYDSTPIVMAGMMAGGLTIEQAEVMAAEGVSFNIAYATMCAECLAKALRCDEYQVEQVTFFNVSVAEMPRRVR